MKGRNLAVILAGFCLSGCVTRRAADLLTVPRRTIDAGHFERETATSPRRFEVAARDKVTVSVLELDPSPGVAKRGTAYLFHGFGNHKEQMLPVAKRLADAGFRCIAWDSRGHGRSGGERASYGMLEVDDALRVIKVARKRGHRPRGEEVVWGYSMGAAVALQTLPELPQVKSAVLLASFSDLGQVLSHQAGQHYHGAMKPLLPWVRSSVRSTAGFDPRMIKPVDAVKDTRARLLFIHGGSDRVITPDHSTRLLEACAPGQGERILLPGLSHGAVMWDLPEATYAAAIDFLTKP